MLKPAGKKIKIHYYIGVKEIVCVHYMIRVNF